MKKSTIKKKSFLGLLTTNFISFSLIIMVGVVGIFLFTNHLLSIDSINLPRKSLSHYNELLISKNFEDIPVKRLFGKSGGIDVVDTNGAIVFSSFQNSSPYTVGELECISQYGCYEKIEVADFESEINKNHYLITKKIYISDSKVEEQYLLLDANYKIISGTIPTSKLGLTQKEFDYLTYNYFNEAKISKYSFTDKSDESFTVVIVNSIGTVNRAPAVVIGVTILIAFLFYFLLLFLYIVYINKKVQNPLRALDKAMSNFSSEGYGTRIEYSGAQEFESLSNSFNNMATLLEDSEKERLRLEQDKQRMMAGLSHDLKTPITVIQGFSRAIRDNLMLDSEKNSYLDTIISQSDSMVRLINSFYEFSKLEHPDFALNPAACDIAEHTRQYLANKYNEFDLNGFDLEADIAEGELVANLDISQFLRVYDNLIANCFKYNVSGTSLYISLHALGKSISIIIADNGTGIREDLRPLIFTPFVVGESSRNKQGSGLGLAICKRIVAAHHGNILLSDTPLAGFNTQFEITIPCANIDTPCDETFPL